VSRAKGKSAAAAWLLIAMATCLEAQVNMENLFDKAAGSHGPEYLRLEMELRQQGPAAEAVLRDNLRRPDPIDRLLAQVLLNWTGAQGADYQAALDYLDYLPARLARTPITSPSPTGIATYLRLHFESRVADLLALRLVKGSDWPRWRVLGVLFYLEERKLPATTEALIRFAEEARDTEWASKAVQVIRAVKDPELRVKIAAERKRAEAAGRAFPLELGALEREPQASR
jgi:hypothetical protein